MFRLEDKLLPRVTGSSWHRDALNIATLAVLWCLLMQGMSASLFAALKSPLSLFFQGSAPAERISPDLAGQLASPFLLMTLGFLLALRCGAIDLSVWAGAALGGVVSAWLIMRLGPSAPDSPRLVALCLLAGAVAGMVLGAVNGLLVAYVRLPSVVVTLVTAAITVGALSCTLSGRNLQVKDNTFSQWYLSPDAEELDDGDAPAGPAKKLSFSEAARPLSTTRVLLVSTLFAFALIVLALTGQCPSAHRVQLAIGLAFFGILVAEILGVIYGRMTKILFLACGGVILGVSTLGGERLSRWSSNARMLAALCASGFLAGSAGALWLLDQGSTPIPSAWRVVDDLRVPAAAVLAGGWLLAGKNRSILAVALLPLALLLTTGWQMRVWSLSHWGLCLHPV